MRQTTVLLVGDEPGDREPVESSLREWGYKVWLASSETAMEIAHSANPDIVICSNLELLVSLKTGNPSRRMIFAAANPTVDLAVTAMKKGAADFIAKPFDYLKLREVLKEAENAPGTTGITAAQAERELILKTLERTGNNKAEAARMLGLDVKTIRNKLKTYGSSV